MSELTPDRQHTRLRIVGKPNDARGYALSVHNADTGEEVTNISRIVLTLDATRLNYADVTYYPGSHIWPDAKMMALKDSEVDVTAYVGSEQYEKVLEENNNE